VIFRTYVACSGCQAVTALRLGIGYDESVPFEFECEACSQTISGILALDQESAQVLGLRNLAGATQTFEDRDREPEADYVHTHHPDFPSREEGSTSPFIDAFSRHDDAFPRQMARSAVASRAAVSSSDIARLLKNYRRERWDHFASGAEAYLEGMSLDTSVERDQALHVVCEFATVGLVGCEQHYEFMFKVNDALLACIRHSPAAARGFLRECTDNLDARSVRLSLYELIPRFLARLPDDLKLALFEWNPEHLLAPFPSGLLVNSASRYHELKALYVDSYEALARSLTFLTGLVNLRERGDHDSYAPHPSMPRFAPTSMADFARKSHAPKVEMLSGDPIFGDWSKGVLDAPLRNAIGHNQLVLDEPSEMVTYPLNRSGLVSAISYGEFQFKLLRTLFRCQEATHVLKLIIAFRELDVDNRS
jgi:hypothetical protein